VSAPLALALLILASVAFAGCGSSRRACSSPREQGPETLQSEVLSAVCDWQDRQRFSDAAVPGAKVFASSGCVACHTYLGVGSRNLGARDLSAAGRRHGFRFFERYVADPARFGDDVMPTFRALGRRRLHQLAVFLAASKGPR
jgi:mono/diheme cytochrome c family protein